MIHAEMLGRGVAPALLVAGLAVGISADSPNDAAAYDNSSIGCYEPTQAELDTVDDLLTNPLPDKHSPADSSNKRAQPDYPALARHYGLTVPDMSLQQQAATAYSHRAPFQTMYGIVGDYLQEYDITLSIATTDQLRGSPGRTPTQAELESDTARYEIAEIAEAFAAGLPEEYISLSGVKHIILAAETGDAAYAMTDKMHDTIAVDVTTLAQDPTLVGHELFHEIDSAECGGTANMYADQGFANLNGAAIYNGTGQADHVTVRGSAVRDAETKLIDEQSDRTREACADQADYIRLLGEAVSFSDYGLTNVVEDKAEIGKNIVFPNGYSRMLDPHSPLIRAKFEYLVARMYHFRPQVVRYLSTMSSRPFADQDVIVKDCPAK